MTCLLKTDKKLIIFAISMKQIKVVAAVIIRDGKVFATQRGYGEFKDWWEFPGGETWPGRDAGGCSGTRDSGGVGHGDKGGPVCDLRGVGLPYLSPKHALLSL